MAKKGYFTVGKAACRQRRESHGVQSDEQLVAVAIIPYTFEHTNFCDIKVGTVINLSSTS